MQNLTERILRLGPPGGLFDDAVVRVLFAGSSAGARRALVHRASRCGEVHRLKPGVYCLDLALRHSCLHPFVIAALLHLPAHISFESALGYHGLIPEAVHSVTSATVQRSRSFKTQLGLFSFVRVPMNDPRAGVEAVKLGRSEWAFIASPLRAIADLLYVRRREITGNGAFEFLCESMRIEPDEFRALSWDDFDEILTSLRSKRTRNLLAGLREGAWT